MSLFDPLLVPLDGSEIAAAAAGVARTIAAGTGDRTLLVSVIEPGGPGWSVDVEMRAMTAAREMLDAHGKTFTSPVESRVVTGAPAQSIARAAVDFEIGLLVLTPRGRGALASALLGSVSRELLVGCRSPILMVHGPVEPGKPIVCGVDASPASRNVVAFARILADAVGSPLHVVHVINADLQVARHPERYNIDPARWRAACDAAIGRAFGEVRAEYGPTTTEHVLYGIPTGELARYAAEVGATVVVVGRKGESGNDVDSFFSIAFALATRGKFSALIV